jgi:hypothetical protein
MNRSDSYIGTFTHTADDAEKIKSLRKFCSFMNKQIKNDRASFDSYYIKLQGRLGKDNPNAWKYRRGTSIVPHNNYSGIRLKDADHMDAYIYRRSS